MRRNWKLWMGLTAAVALSVPLALWAQDTQPGGERRERGERGERAERGERGERPRWNPEEARQRFSEMMREQMQASEDEWKVLQPKIERVMQAQRHARAGGLGMWGGRGPGAPGGGPGGDQPESPVSKAGQDLRDTLQNQSATAADITAKLTALREARKKAATELEAARADLKGVLTQRQEALLVMSGMLE